MEPRQQKADAGKASAQLETANGSRFPTKNSNISIYRNEITLHHHQAQKKAGEAVQHAIEAGKLLNIAKAEVKHGQWLSFVDSAGVGIRTAQGYMKLAKNAEALNTQDLAHLGVEKALRYLAKPRPPKIDPTDILIAPNLDYVLQFYPEITGVHPACNMTPMLRPEEFREFARSIIECGLILPLTITTDGLLIDGKIRLVACYVTGTPIRIKEIAKNPYRYVNSVNIMRSNFTSDMQKYGCWKRLMADMRGGDHG